MYRNITVDEFFGLKNPMNETAGAASSMMFLPDRHFVLVVYLDVVCAHDLNEVLSELEQVVGPLRLGEADEVQHGLLRVRVRPPRVEEEARHVGDACRRLRGRGARLFYANTGLGVSSET